MAAPTTRTKSKSPTSPSPKKPKRTNSVVSFAGPLDVADARRALFADGLARLEGASLCVRLSGDTAAKAIDAIATDLDWLGITWEHDAAESSASASRYRQYAQRLIAAGATESIAGATQLRLPAGRTVVTDDLLGAVAFNNSSFHSVGLLTADGRPDPGFAEALDVLLSARPFVVREERELERSAREQLILAALDRTPPRYAHLGNLQATSDSGLPSIASLRRAGFLPAAVSEFLRRLDHGPVAFDERDLRAFNARELRALPTTQLSAALGGSMQRVGLLEDPIPAAAQRWIETFLLAYRDAFETLGEALAIVRDLRAEAVIVPALELEALRNRQVIFYLDAVGQYVDAQVELRDLPLDHDLAAIAGEFGIAPADAFRAVRTTLTGMRDGPPLTLLFPLLGHDRILIRIGAISSHLLHGRGLEPIKFGPGGVPFATIVPSGPPQER